MQKVMNWTFRADGDANFWTILDAKNHWLGRVQLNGEFMPERQEAIISMISATPDMMAALRLAESFMAGFEDDEMQDGINQRLAAVRSAIAKAEGRAVVTVTSNYWERWDKYKAAALATLDGTAFAAAGFEFFHNGGGCSAWRKLLADGRYVMVTDSEGSSHFIEGDADSYIVGFYASTDDVEGIVSDAHQTAESAIGAAMHFATMDQLEIAARRAGWRTGDIAGQLIKNIAGASTANVFNGDWEALCRNQGIQPIAKAEGRANSTSHQSN